MRYFVIIVIGIFVHSNFLIIRLFGVRFVLSNFVVIGKISISSILMLKLGVCMHTYYVCMVISFRKINRCYVYNPAFGQLNKENIFSCSRSRLRSWSREIKRSRLNIHFDGKWSDSGENT